MNVGMKNGLKSWYLTEINLHTPKIKLSCIKQQRYIFKAQGFKN
jgi:hypothetical protein